MPKRNETSPDHWSDIVGLPDEWDLKNLTNLINTFKRETFTYNGASMTGAQWIKFEVADAKKQHQQDGVGQSFNKFGVKSADSDLRVGTAMPNILWSRIEESYPTIFRDRKHYSWFVKNFREFAVPGKW